MPTYSNLGSPVVKILDLSGLRFLLYSANFFLYVVESGRLARVSALKERYTSERKTSDTSISLSLASEVIRETRLIISLR